MVIWLLKDGEALPLQPGGRSMRTGMLASHLARRGHEVVWWCSTFAHFGKQLLSSQDREVEVAPNYRLRMLHSGSYPTNVSLQRLVHHNRFALRLTRELPRYPAPDVMVCCYPIIEMAFQAVRYARAAKVPILLDLRDRWPDYFLERLPPWGRELGKLPLAPLYWQGRRALAGADGLVGISPGFLRWGLEVAGRPAGPLDGVSPHGFDPVELKGPPPAGLERLEGRTVFVFCGSFTPPYDLRLVTAVARQLEARPELHFVLAGEGPEMAAIRERSQALSNVSLMGWLDSESLQHLLARSHVGLLPWASRTRDAMPNKVFEYLAAGLPIVSSARGDLEDLLRQHQVGFSYRAGCADELRALVLRLAEDRSLRHRLSENAARTFREQFQASEVAARYEERLFRAVARGGQPHKTRALSNCCKA